MAPSLEVPVAVAPAPVGNIVIPKKEIASDNKFGYVPGRTTVEDHTEYAHEDLLPSFPDIHWDALEYTPYEDRGLRGDPKFRNLLKDATAVFDYNPKIGTEIHGVDLAKLTDAQKDDLARLIAYRGVVFFRAQKDFDIDAQRDLGRHFGKLHKVSYLSLSSYTKQVLMICSMLPPLSPRRRVSRTFTSSIPATMLEITELCSVQASCGTQTYVLSYQSQKQSDSSDTNMPGQVTYEVQPPSYTSLKLLTGPPLGGGGDTLWSSQYAAYDILSPFMQTYLKSLTALHSADMQANDSRALGRPVRREPVTTKHPLIRTNPVTGWNSLFFNPGFVTKIVGIPKAESDAIIKYLTDVVATTQEMHARFQWGKDDIAFWDNRTTVCISQQPHRPG